MGAYLIEVFKSLVTKEPLSNNDMSAALGRRGRRASRCDEGPYLSQYERAKMLRLKKTGRRFSGEAEYGE